MIKDLIIQKVSYKTRGVKAGGKWLEMASDVDLNELTIGKIYTLEIVDTFDDTLKIVRIVK